MIDNAIWLCSNCGTLIDNDAARFPATLLREWKNRAEAEAFDRIGRPTAFSSSPPSPQLSAIIRIVARSPLWISLNLLNTGRGAVRRPAVLVRVRPPNSLIAWPLDSDQDDTGFVGRAAPLEKIMYSSYRDIIIYPTMGKKVVDVRTRFLPQPDFVMAFALTLFALDMPPVEVDGSLAASAENNLLTMPPV